jgi:alpha-L-fucosidase
LEHYHSARDLVFILVDIVNRGGNLLLDIGPDADGTIPVIMEERLMHIGDWLKINGDAIYGTKPWTATRQWSEGEAPKLEYNKEHETAYNVTKSIDERAPGKARIDAFFTAKGNGVTQSCLDGPAARFAVKDIPTARSVTLLGASTPLKWKAAKGALTIDLLEVPEELRAQPAFVLKISR